MFAPSDAEVEKALRVLAPFGSAVQSGCGVPDGRMLDEAVVRMNRRIATLAKDQRREDCG